MSVVENDFMIRTGEGEGGGRNYKSYSPFEFRAVVEYIPYWDTRVYGQ